MAFSWLGCDYPLHSLKPHDHDNATRIVTTRRKDAVRIAPIEFIDAY